MKKMATVFLCIIISIFSISTPFAAEDDYKMAYSTVFPDGYTSPENAKVVFLTFDDGPTKYTPQIIEILNRHDVPATFFVVGNTEYTHYMGEIIENGHAIGLHSYDHNFEQIYSSREAFFNDLQKIDDIVFDETGIRSMIMRFPGGSSVERGATKAMMNQLKKDVTEKGYQFFDWNCDSADARGVNSSGGAISKIKAMEKEAGDIVIVLMHDTKEITTEYLPDVIEYFKAQGYAFLPLCLNSPAIHHTW